jgi:hypothetical protein
VVKAIRIYVEGGGRSSWRTIKDGFGKFLDPLRQMARSRGLNWNLVVGGSRNDTFEKFRMGLRSHPKAFNLLLVDSESSVALPRWEHLRRQDRWDVPHLSEDQCHLMVQMVEAWLVADPDALADYYGQGFRRGALPSRKDVEDIPKGQLLRSLNRATMDTKKGRYDKIRHCADLLGLLDPDRVRQRAHHCDLLFKTLESRIRE